jgi:hypothetical protein
MPGRIEVNGLVRSAMHPSVRLLVTNEALFNQLNRAQNGALEHARGAA